MREKGESVKEFREIQGFRKLGRDTRDAGRLIPARDAGMDTQKRGEGWRLMIFCARATRGRGLPSLDARSRRSVSPHP